MDIRNIKEKPNIEEGQDLLLSMYELSDEQFEGYKLIEKLPEYPLNINTQKSQVILKDFISRVIEELVEGYESLLGVLSILKPVGWNIDKVENYNAIINNLQNANEEQADAMGFFLVLLRYSNILSPDIYSWSKLQKPVKDSNNPLDDLIVQGIYLQLIEKELSGPNHTYEVFNENLVKEHTELDYSSIKEVIPGFTHLSETLLEEHVIYLWRVIYHLNIARNLLKNRTWKQTQVITKEVDYQEALVKAFVYYLGYLGINYFDGVGLYTLFFKKQKLNLWRQKTNY